MNRRRVKIILLTVGITYILLAGMMFKLSGDLVTALGYPIFPCMMAWAIAVFLTRKKKEHQ